LVGVRDQSGWKEIQGRQEWITAIEVLDAASLVDSLLVLFASMHLFTAWISAVGKVTITAISGSSTCLNLGANGACLTLPLGECLL
jgi:hypothetical protein